MKQTFLGKEWHKLFGKSIAAKGLQTRAEHPQKQQWDNATLNESLKNVNHFFHCYRILRIDITVSNPKLQHFNGKTLKAKQSCETALKNYWYANSEIKVNYDKALPA